MLGIASGRERLSSMELAMKIRDIIQRGRELNVQCPGPHDMDHNDLRGKLRCSVCGRRDARVLLIPQTDRQMRQGRQR